jgi:hypothetical protein
MRASIEAAGYPRVSIIGSVAPGRPEIRVALK